MKKTASAPKLLRDDKRCVATYVDAELKDALVERARLEGRSLSNLLAFILRGDFNVDGD